MIIKVKFIEMIWDNYQGGSGNPIIRSILIDLPDDIKLCEIESKVSQELTIQGVKAGYNQTEVVYPIDSIVNIQILPTIKSKMTYNPYKCKYCDKQCRDYSDLQSHLETVHKDLTNKR